MKRYTLLLVVVLAAALSAPAMAQFTDKELAQREEWEEFLASAEIVSSEQMGQSEGVTLPWVLELRGGGVEKKAVWKNVVGRKSGFWECWKCEIAAYRLDKYLGLNAVPPAIEREFKGTGALILWADSWIDGRKKQTDKIPVASARIGHWNARTAIQRAFDNLIGNVDRHLGNEGMNGGARMCAVPVEVLVRVARDRTGRSGTRWAGRIEEVRQPERAGNLTHRGVQRVIVHAGDRQAQLGLEGLQMVLEKLVEVSNPGIVRHLVGSSARIRELQVDDHEVLGTGQGERFDVRTHVVRSYRRVVEADELREVVPSAL